MKKIIFIIMILIIFVFTGCKQKLTNDNELLKDEKINVLVSILPQKAFVNAVGKDLVNVKELIPPGGSPATYEPKPSDLILVENTDIYFKIGHIPFEKSHIKKFLELNSKMKIIDTSSNIKLRYFHQEEKHQHKKDATNLKKHKHEKRIDPHIWLAPLQAKKQVDLIAKSLSKEDPLNENIYNANAKQFKKELDKLHSEIKTELSKLKINKIMVFHPAWGYFADEYGLEQIAIEQSGKEPTAKQLQHLIEKAKKENIKIIFVQSQFNKEIAKSIAQEVGAVIVSINPLSEDYINNLKSVATKISNNSNK